MPKYRSSLSLRELCLRHIAQNFDYWAKSYVEEYVKQGEVPLYVVGPFDEWTSCLTQELLDMFVQLKNTKSYQLHLLLHVRLESLDLSEWSQVVQDNIANMVSLRCYRLKSLILSNCKRIKPQGLAEIVRSLPNLRQLDLSYTRVSDQVLAIVGANCPHLVELSLRGTAISDGGLACLTENPVTRNPGCRRLRKLDLSCIPMAGHHKSFGRIVLGKLASLSHAGVASLLNYCCDLEVMDCEDTYGAVKLLQVMFSSTSASEPSKIKRLKLHISEDEEKLADLTTLFPHLIELTVEGVYPYQQLPLLAKLKNLKNLSLHADLLSFDEDEGLLVDNNVTLFFDQGVKPLLFAVGDQLTSLSLHYIPYVDLSLVGESCRHLHTLMVEFHHDILMSESQNGPHMFKTLR